MATAVALMIGGAVTNALAFSGSNYMFHSMEGNSAAERKRHDLAIEQLETATEDWRERKEKTLGFLNQELQKEKIADSDFEDIDMALSIYHEYHPKAQVALPPKPRLADYYTPSKAQQYGEYAVIVGGMATTAFLVFRFL